MTDDTTAVGTARDQWETLAACRGQGDVMFPRTTTGYQTARDICRSCTVTDECLAWALEHHIAHGVWGGFDEDERRRMRRRAQKAAARAKATA